MSEGLKLEELEAYRQELSNAQREGRPCKYRNPRDVFAEDPNLDSYLVEKDAGTLEKEQELIDGPVPTARLSDPGQEHAEEAARLGAADHSLHQNEQATPNPSPPGDNTQDENEDDAELEDSLEGETPTELQQQETPFPTPETTAEVPVEITQVPETTATETPPTPTS